MTKVLHRPNIDMMNYRVRALSLRKAGVMNAP